MDSEIITSAKTIDKINLSQWISTLKNLSARLPLIFLLCLSITNFTSKIFGQSANLDQIRNGSAASPINPGNWVNGNAGPSNAHFAEGYSIPYRALISDLVGNSATVHHLIIEWDTKHGNGHALDYITHYQNLDNPTGSHQATFGHVAETIDPTIGTAFSGPPDELQPIPAPSSAGSEVAGQPTTSFNNLPGLTGNPDITSMAIWGGAIVSLTYVFQDPPDGTTAQTETRLDIAFTSTNGSTALLAWGGHIAAESDWGAGRGATGVSGSPYHTRVISLDGKGGNQDRSLKADAVIIPPPVCNISAAQFACPETASLTFDATGSSTGTGVTYEWTLTNGSPSAGAMIQGGNNTGFSVIVVPIGTDFIAGGTFNLSLTVTKAGAISTTTCTRVPAGTIINTVVTASANPTQIDLTTLAHNTTLTADIGAGSTHPSNTDYTYLWEIVTAGTLGSLTNAATRIATYTADVSDPSSITFKVTATLNVSGAPACVDDAQTTVTIVGAGVCDVTPQGPVCEGATTSHTGSPNPKPATATYTWSLEAFGGGGSTTSTLVGGNSGGVTQQVNANEDYRIVLTQVYDNPALNTSCFEDVTVNDINPGVIDNAQTICVGEDPAALTNVTSATGDGNITYQWQISTTNCSSGFTDIPGANAATYDPGPLNVTTFYRRTATSTLNSVACSENSNCVEITVTECADHIFPTGTTCDDFTDQTVPPLESLCFQQSGGFVTNASAPGAWFYYTSVTKPAGATQITVRVNQTNDGVISGLFTTSEIKAWTSSCTQITRNVTTNFSNPSIPEITITGLSSAELTIVISVKYNSNSIVGSAVSGTSSVYTFNASSKTNGVFTLVPGSGETITAEDCGNITSARGINIQPERVSVIPTKLKVSAYPNPYKGVINFNFVAPVSGKASLEVYDLLGRRLALIFQGNVNAGMQKSLNYRVPSIHRVPMIYKLSIGDKTSFGKLLPGTE